MAKTRRRQASKGFSRSQLSLMAMIVVFGLAIGGIGVIIGNFGAKNPIRTATLQATARLAVASVSPLNSDSSSWYCNWYLPGQSGLTAATVLLANTSSKELTANVKTYAGNAQQSRSLKIPPHSFLRYPETVTPTVQFGAVSFVANGGGTVAEMEIAGQHGTAVSPCNSSPSAEWVALGSDTLPGSASGISIFNPFGQDAVVDVSMSSGSQKFAPGPLQGLVIAPYSSNNIDLTQYFSGQSHVAVSVKSRIGRIVLSGIVQRNSSGDTGLAALATFPATASQWSFPVGELSANQNQEILVYNPNSTKVSVKLKFSYLDLTAVASSSTATTADVTTSSSIPDSQSANKSQTIGAGYELLQSVAADSVSTISVKAQTAVQAGLSYQVSLTVAGGLGVVAADEYIGSVSNPNVGYQVVGGTPLSSQHWIALYDPSFIGVANAQAWLATVGTGNNYPESEKTPLVDLGPTYLAPPGKIPASLPTAQAQLAHSSNKVLKTPTHLNSVGALSPTVTGIIVSSKSAFTLGSVMGTTPADMYVVPVLPFAN